MDYSDRKVVAATVGGVSFLRFEDGTTGVGGSVEFTLSDFLGGTAGPGIGINVSIQLDAAASVQAAERAVLDAAVAVLRRLAAEPLDALYLLQEQAWQVVDQDGPS